MLAISFRTVGLAALAASGAGGAFAETSGQDWFVRVGAAQLTLADDADFSVMGQPLPGAGLETDAQYTASVEIGRRFGDHFSVDLTLGVPPTAEADGTGMIAGLGRLAEVTYGPMALTGLYHPFRNEKWDLYVGGGVSYMMIVDTKDGALTNVEADDDVGPVLQAGVSYSINSSWAVFADVKQAWLETTATGSLGGAPVTADITMDPLVVSTGVQFSF
jgi:outer membrane protein